jgi:DNA polymerase-3 subunit beta
VGKKTTMPILNNFLLSASDGKLRISATDLEITAIASGTAQVRAAGSTTVNAKIFSEIVRELPNGDITMKVTEGERLEIVAKNSKLRMVGASSDEFPSLPGMNFQPKVRVTSTQLSEMIGKTLYAVSQDDSRHNLVGVCFEMEAGKSKKEKPLRLVATDGHRLGMVTRPMAGLDLEERIIVPRKGLSEMKRILDAEEGKDVGIEVREGYLVLEASKSKISVHLIDAEFPDYNQVIPKGKTSHAIIASGDLSHALRRVALMVSDKSKCVRFDFNKESVRISSSSPELGDATDELPIKYSGEPVSVGFNALYILDFLGTLGEPGNVVVELNGALGPGKFSPEGDDSCVGIVMPMRL